MPEQRRFQELISATIDAAYAAPSDGSVYVRLKQQIEAWDEKEYQGKEVAGSKIAQDLQALINHLEKKGLKPQADDVFRILLQTFPESHFSAVPMQSEAVTVDFDSLKVMDLGLDSDEQILEIRNSFNLFEQQYRLVTNDLQQLAKEIDLKLFRELGTGDAAELYRRFKSLIEIVSGTRLNDAPWALMNQLALKLNNSLSAFNQAYTLLHEIGELKIATPSEEMVQELEKNEIFFLRNYYWLRIDEAVAKGDNSSIVYYIDRLMPMASGGHEKSNLLLLRANAIKRNDEPVKGCVSFFVVGVLLMVVLSFAFSSTDTKKGKGQSISRWNAFWKNLSPRTESEQALNFGSGQSSFRVLNKAGLEEIKPPEQKTERKLNIAELRHVIFQRVRLEHLSQQELTPEEVEQLKKLWEDWRKRCEFYNYDAEDRERAETEAQRNMESIIEDAAELKKEMSEDDAEKKGNDGRETEVADPEKKEPEEPVETPEKEFEEHKILLNLENPVHVKKIIGKLAQLGFYKGDLASPKWNKKARKALIEFKVSRMSLLDDSWDIKTQEALLGK